MNRALFTSSVIVGVAVMISMSSMEPAFAVKTLDCAPGSNWWFKCSGGQPVVDDRIAFQIVNGYYYEGTVTSVSNFDSASDRRGNMIVVWDPVYGLEYPTDASVQITGKL